MEAEVEFLTYAQIVAPRKCPEIIAVDRERRCVVMEYIKGAAYQRGSCPTKSDAEEAIKFFDSLNTDLKTAQLVVTRDASEGFLRLSQHMENVNKRISEMETSHLPLEYKDRISELLLVLREEAMRVGDRLKIQIGSGKVEDSLNPAHRCISPGDFGFHNAIRTDQGVRFLDFEFAGWDDPAKAAADFKLQPKVPVSNDQGLGFSGWLREYSSQIYQRQAAIRPVLQLKWACIILAILKPERLEAMLRVIKDVNLDELIQQRLALSTLYLGRR